MCKLFANKLYSINTYFYSHVWIMMVNNNFDAQNWLFICLQISPQIFAILQNFAINNLRDQQFCTLLCELEWLVVVFFTGNALQVEVLPGMVCSESHHFYYRSYYLPEASKGSPACRASSWSPPSASASWPCQSPGCWRGRRRTPACDHWPNRKHYFKTTNGTNGKDYE